MSAPSPDLEQLLTECGELGLWQVLMAGVCSLVSGEAMVFVLWAAFARAPVPASCVQYGSNSSKWASADECVSWKFNYSDSDVRSSMVEDFQLVGSRAHWVNHHGTLYFLGLITGSCLAGHVSDSIGRLKLARVAHLLHISAGVGIWWTESFLVSCVLWFLVSNSVILNLVAVYTYSSEIATTAAVRGVMPFVLSGASGLGLCAAPALSLLLPSWRDSALAIALFALLPLTMLCLSEESPRWLWQQGHHRRFQRALTRIALVNRHPISPLASVTLEKMALNDRHGAGVFHSITEDLRALLGMRRGRGAGTESGGLLRMMRESRALAGKMGLVCVVWVAANSLNYGLLFGAEMFDAGLHVYGVVQGLAVVAGSVVGALASTRVGRRPLTSAGFFVAAASILCGCVVQRRAVLLGLAVAGKMAVLVVFTMSYSWTAELVPTAVRSSALGVGSTVARVAGLAIPYYGLLGALWPPLPQVLYAGMGAAAALLCLLLPETRNRPLLSEPIRVDLNPSSQADL